MDLSPGDIVVNIMSRLDGRSLAACASTCKSLHDASQDKMLWKKLCHETWPSTSMLQIASPDFKNLYADAFPLILYDPSKLASKAVDHNNYPSTPADYASLVDIYYKGNAIFSKVVDNIGRHTTSFLKCPFEVDLLSSDGSDSRAKLPPSDASNNERDVEMCYKILEEIRMSWILLNMTKGKVVNISSWKPWWIKRRMHSEDYTLRFGSIMQVKGIMCECVIIVKCSLMMGQECITFKEITLTTRDANGFNLSGEDSLAVMDEALTCSRSIKHDRVNAGYKKFESNEKLNKLDNLAISGAMIVTATLLGVCYIGTTLL